MRLATIRDGSCDGRLALVSRDLTRFADASPIAPTVQRALERWSDVALPLADLAKRVDSNEAGERLDPSTLMAVLPRSWQWLDASAFPSHGRLMETALRLPPLETSEPLMYQGLSNRFLAPLEDVRLPDIRDGIDFEGEFAVITDEVPMGISADAALTHIRLIVLVNDWSLRGLAAAEFKTGFGWVRAKPACSMGPIGLTPDELGTHWANGRLAATLKIKRNGELFGSVPTSEMQYHFGELIAHAAYSRTLCAGTVIGSGTVSTADARHAGSCCIAERRAIEAIDDGQPSTPFMTFGERVRLEALSPSGNLLPFGTIDQQVVGA